MESYAFPIMGAVIGVIGLCYSQRLLWISIWLVLITFAIGTGSCHLILHNHRADAFMYPIDNACAAMESAMMREQLRKAEAEISRFGAECGVSETDAWRKHLADTVRILDDCDKTNQEESKRALVAAARKKLRHYVFGDNSLPLRYFSFAPSHHGLVRGLDLALIHSFPVLLIGLPCLAAFTKKI